MLVFRFQFLFPFILLYFKKRKIDLNFGFTVQLGPKFMKESGLKHVTFSTADGALEAAPAVRDSVCLLEFVHLNFLIIKYVIFCVMTILPACWDCG